MNGRRECLKACAAAAITATLPRHGRGTEPPTETRSGAARSFEPAVEAHVRGLLVGSLIGDALGVPIEFKPPQEIRSWMPAARKWPERRRVDASLRRQLADSLRLLSNESLRPTAEPYGLWMANAPAGAISDDSRMKIVLMRAMRRAGTRNDFNRKDIAHAFRDFRPVQDQDPGPQLSPLIAEGLREYRRAADAILEPDDAVPLERLWGGVDNCSGQMMFPPLAAIDAGDPVAAYRACYRYNFVDTGAAKDIAAAINAGLAAVLDPTVIRRPEKQRWQRLLSAMRDTDPLGYGDVPFVGRRLHHWMELAESIAQRSERKPAMAYRMLESEGKPVFYWDAHFTFLVPLTMLHLCDFDPLAAMHLTLDFGHDTDSYSQLLGAMIGAVHGRGLFSGALADPVLDHLRIEYGESIDQWVEQLAAFATPSP